MNQKSNISRAVAIICGSEQAIGISGQVTFCRKRNCVLITATVKGLPTTPSGFFGFHIHEGSDCSGDNFAGTKNHYNPSATPHPSHSGDLPPLLMCNSGAFMTVATDRFTIEEIIGRTVVIHSMPDDFISQPSGNAGEKIACGVICRA